MTPLNGLRITDLPDGRKAIIIRTSDRIAFKQCRRKWGWSSHLKYNLGPKALAAPLWFGSAIHYALEDYHGYNKFGRPSEAFKAYCMATAKNHLRDLPTDAQDHFKLGVELMDYYVDTWLIGYPRQPDQTYWAPNPTTGELEPQVEVNFEIPIPIEQSPILVDYCRRLGVDVVLYRGTIDRVVIDEYGFLWVDEYKTAKVAMNTHFQTDPQVTTYVWAANLIYDKPIAGVIYHQFVKRYPEMPKPLSSGRLSTAANLVCSSVLYRRQLENLYGDVLKAPSQNQAKLNQLMGAETQDRDRYIIRERIHRNARQCQHESWKIMMELEDMLNPDLPLYPNPTRDCSRMCSFMTPCVNMDDGSDWEQLLENSYAERDQDVDRLWRRRLPSPGELLQLQQQNQEPDLLAMQLEAVEKNKNFFNEDDYKNAQIASGDYDAPEWDTRGDPFSGMNTDGSFSMADVPTGG